MARRFAPLLLVPLYLGLSVFWLSGLIGQTGTAVPGAGAGDNLTFVWNTWWMATALHTGAPFFFSPMVFAPFGVDLTLHTHTALPSLVAAVIAPGNSLVLGTNLVIGLQLLLNFVCAFALAFRVTRDMPAALMASVVFGWSPYLGSHLLGHFNLVGPWVLALTALLVMARLEDRSLAGGLALAAVLGIAPYIDYYAAVYCLILVGVFALHRNLSLSVSRDAGPRDWQRRLLRVLLTLSVVVAGVVIAIALGGGGAIAIGSLTLSMRSVANPMAILGMLIFLAAAVAVLPRVRARADTSGLAADMARLAMPLALGIALMLPLLIRAAMLWQRGEYVTQKYFWRSAPPGVDVATLVLGNPSSWLTHSLTTAAYARLGIDGIEQVAWLGPGVMALCGVAFMLRKTDTRVRLWLAISAVFGIWALGPSLFAFGRDTYAFLPAVLVRYVPIVANARIPGRAFVVVYLAAAVLCAIGIAELRRRRPGLAILLAAVILLDYFPRPVPVFRLDRPVPYEELARHAGEGVLCELPLGLRDGFGQKGRFDSRVLTYQMIHQHPMTGGFAARLSPRLVEAYDRSPILGVLSRLSAGKPLAGERVLSRDDAGAALRSAGIRYVMLNRLTAPADLQAYVQDGLPLRVLSEDGERTLYEVAR